MPASSNQSSNQTSNQNQNYYSSQESTTTPVQLPSYTPGQYGILDYLTNYVNQGMSKSVPSYPGMLYAPLNAYENTWLSGNSPSFQYKEDALRNALSGKPAYEVNADTSQQYWNRYMEPQFQKQWKNLNESYAPNYFGGAQGIAAGEFNTGKLGEYAKLMYQDEQARRQALTEGLNRQAQIAVPAWSAQENYEQERGQLQRQIDESKIASDYMRYLSGEEVGGVRNEAYNPYTKLAFQLLGISPYTYAANTEASGESFGEATGSTLGTSTGTSQGPSLVDSLFASALPGLVQGGIGIASDYIKSLYNNPSTDGGYTNTGDYSLYNQGAYSPDEYFRTINLINSGGNDDSSGDEALYNTLYRSY
jgi:hypothetical protein